MRVTHTFRAFVAVAFVLAGVLPADAQTADEFFDPGTLQEIRLWINTRDLRTLHERYRDDTYYTADFQWRNLRVRNVGVRSRGVASRSATKLALRVDFNRYAASQQFLGLKSIILKNLWQDGSMMHERLAMALFTKLGQPASRESYCRLYINNELQGLYSIVESVDSDFLQRTLGESSGYLFSYQFRLQFRGEYLGEELASYKALFEAQNHEREADSTLYLPIHNLFREANEPDDAVWRERVEQYVDLSQFMTQAAIENFLAEDDGMLGTNGMNNFSFYRLNGTSRHRFIPWDKDSAFLQTDFSVLSRIDDNVLSRKAFAYADLRELYLQVLETAARAAAEDNWLEAEIVRAAELIAGAVAEDTRKPFSTEAFFESVESLRAFARERPARVLAEIARVRQAR
jgi:spore coat protein CotH